ARLLASATCTADFADHYRTIGSVYDYQWEERWIRDAGYLAIVPKVIANCFEKANVSPAQITHFVMPATLPKAAQAVAKAAGLGEASVRDTLHGICGEAGAAHPLIMLAASLEAARPGDLILLIGFGQGADALLLEVTPAILDQSARLGVKGH